MSYHTQRYNTGDPVFVPISIDVAVCLIRFIALFIVYKVGAKAGGHEFGLFTVATIIVLWFYYKLMCYYVGYAYPIVYCETSWKNIQEHLRQFYRRGGMFSWLMCQRSDKHSIRFLKEIVSGQKEIFFL